MGMGTGNCIIPGVTSRHTKVVQTQVGQIRVDDTVTEAQALGKNHASQTACSIDASSEQKQMFSIQGLMTV